MKQFVRWTVLLTLLLTINAFAQEAIEVSRFNRTGDGTAQIEVAKPLGSQFSFVTKTVKGAPYSAVAEAETIQILTDGNRIRNKTVTTVYRDSEGRTRREFADKTPGATLEVFISDPVSGTNYSLRTQERVAVKTQPGGIIRVVKEKTATEQESKQRTTESERTVTINADGRTMNWEQLPDAQRAAVEKKMAEAKEVNVEVKVATGGVMMRKKPGITESLGQQTIEGVMCEGKRTTTTMPAGSIGNDQPINIVSEEWYSPELQVLVLTKQTDPRHGETIYRLTNINRSEPARALFEVPADYTVKENLPMRKLVREEQ